MVAILGISLGGMKGDWGAGDVIASLESYTEQYLKLVLARNKAVGQKQAAE
jgi:hypothetical protein